MTTEELIKSNGYHHAVIADNENNSRHICKINNKYYEINTCLCKYLPYEIYVNNQTKNYYLVNWNKEVIGLDIQDYEIGLNRYSSEYTYYNTFCTNEQYNKPWDGLTHYNNMCNNFRRITDGLNMCSNPSRITFELLSSNVF